jgi:hypothetical protein
MPTISFALFFSKTFQGGPGIPAASKAWATTFNMSETFTGLENFDIIGKICRSTPLLRQAQSIRTQR